MKPPKSLSDDALVKYADEHIQYELDMLLWSASILAFLAKYKGEGYLAWAINNGLLNSFALHARNLINYLYSRSRQKDFETDVILEDFLDQEIVDEHLPGISPLFDEALTKANKQAAHLSMERIQYEDDGKEWKFIELTRELLKTFASLVPYMSPDRFSDTFRTKLAQSELRIPIVDITIGKSNSGDPISITFALRVSQDGSRIEGVSA